VPPEPSSAAPRAPSRPRPREELPLAHDLGHTGRNG
jgi:hypothetical protein